MPVTPTYPGVYIEELPSGVRSITGVSTSLTAFIGRARRGPVNDPKRVQSYGDFERKFGELWEKSALGYSVQQYFLNGGSDALVVRVVADDAAKATLDLPSTDGTSVLKLAAASEGSWGNGLMARVNHDTRDLETGEDADSLFNLILKDEETGVVETHRNVSTDTENARYVERVLDQESNLVRLAEGTAVPAKRPSEHADPADGSDPFSAADDGTYYVSANADGDDGSDIDADAVKGEEDERTGIYALESEDIFNLLVIPPLTRDAALLDSAAGTSVVDAAIAYCERRRAVFLLDPPTTWDDAETAAEGMSDLGIVSTNAAMYFPALKTADPLKDYLLEEFAPSGAVAGILARTDGQRGVWKAPAGQEATLKGVRELTVKLTDGQNGLLNPLGLNCLRTFPGVGSVVWGARTMKGADRLASEWKYLPVRRLALYIEESLYRGTQWVVFEPNDEPLWAQIRMNIGAFMHRLFRQGAFQGQSPKEAYLVKCDRETTTQDDIDQGIVNIVVGFAPLKPAEFVIIKIKQLAGQTAE